MRHHKIPLVWLSNIPKEKHDQFKERVSLTLEDQVVKQLVLILKDKIESLDKNCDYDSPSWAYRQAHRNGRQEAFSEILTILGQN